MNEVIQKYATIFSTATIVTAVVLAQFAYSADTCCPKAKAKDAKACETTAAVPAAAEAAVAKDTTAADEKRPLITVNGEVLTVAQAQVMVDHGAAGDLHAAAEFWMSIKLKAAESRRRRLDTQKNRQFIMNLYREHYMTRFLDETVSEEMADPTDEQLRKDYDANIDRYRRPAQVQVQHICVQQRDLAEELVKKTTEENADFDALVEQYSTAKDKKSKGKISGTVDVVKRNLGQDVTDAVMAAKKSDILGPFMGGKGFEVVKVLNVQPEQTVEFDKVKEGLIRQFKGQAVQKAQEDLMAKLTADAEIVKTAEFEALAIKAKADAEAARKAAPQRRGIRPPGPPQ